VLRSHEDNIKVEVRLFPDRNPNLAVRNKTKGGSKSKSQGLVLGQKDYVLTLCHSEPVGQEGCLK